MKRFTVLLLFLGGIFSALWAEVRLPAIFSDNMVLQQRTRVNLWGKASPGERVHVLPSWRRTPLVTEADAEGRWRLQVPTPKACRNQQIRIWEKDTLYINNVLIGEVWLCSGQSNMEFPVCKHPDVYWQTGMENAEEELRDADYPELRLFRMEPQLSETEELDDCKGRWVSCKPSELYDFSAIAFVFGRRLHTALRLPVGIIQCTWGGTHAESWTKMSVMQHDSLYAPVLAKFKEYHQAHKHPAVCWNGMVAPILGFTLKGNIWYQAESNWPRAEAYEQVFTNLINSWRKEWKQPDMPFYFMQVAPHVDLPPLLREAQLNVWQSGLKNLGMATVPDAGDSLDIHPRNKRIAGERLALWALAKQYDHPVACCGPLFHKLKVQGDKLILTFKYAKQGLMTPNDAPVEGFVVAGSDGRFYPAKAVIRGSRVEVSSPQVSHPVAVRYGWGHFFRANLYNKEGLPAFPFRSDQWKLSHN
ncbi:MAG: hypothetical protein J6C87_01515 [Bacteroides sp.]|nr:hypothetical protein [Bacteroides sp.]